MKGPDSSLKDAPPDNLEEYVHHIIKNKHAMNDAIKTMYIHKFGKFLNPKQKEKLQEILMSDVPKLKVANSKDDQDAYLASLPQYKSCSKATIDRDLQL